jgi:hypothetical protein
MAAVLEECTNEKQRSVMRLLWAKGLNAKDKEYFMFPVGGKSFADDEEVETEMGK